MRDPEVEAAGADVPRSTKYVPSGRHAPHLTWHFAVSYRPDEGGAGRIRGAKPRMDEV